MSHYDYDDDHDSRGINLSYMTRLPTPRWKEEDDTFQYRSDASHKHHKITVCEVEAQKWLASFICIVARYSIYAWCSNRSLRTFVTASREPGSAEAPKPKGTKHGVCCETLHVQVCCRPDP